MRRADRYRGVANRAHRRYSLVDLAISTRERPFYYVQFDVTLLILLVVVSSIVYNGIYIDYHCIN